MDKLPEEIRDYICKDIAGEWFPSYLKISHEGLLLDWHQGINKYIFSKLERNKPVFESFPVLDGILPFEGNTLVLKFVRLENEKFINIHLIKYENYCWVLLTDSSKEADREIQLKQKIMDQSLLKEEQDRLLDELQKAGVRAEEASKAKSEFLAVMSHEIRTPLNALVGMTNLLGETDLNLEQLEYVDTLKMSSEILLTTLNDVLDYSKIESGKLEIDRHPVKIRALVIDILKLFSYQCIEKNIKLSYELAPEVPSVISGDSTRIRQILLNLINNAIKFTENGEIRVSVTHYGMEHQGLKLLFEIKDTGIGISLDKIKKLFKPFSQVDASTTRKYGGTGLGLVICKQLVSFMGGEIWVESKKNEGTTFFFTLITSELKSSPIKERDLNAKFKISEMAKEAPLKILLVEDEQINQKLALKIFSKMGYQASLVVNGQLAVNAALKEDFDLIFMDIRMPVLDGIEASKIILQKKPKQLIVAMTANAFTSDRDMYSEIGMYSYLSKPISINKLQNLLLEVSKNLKTKQDERAL